MSPRFALCLILACASFPLMARDVRTLAASGGGGDCPDQAAHAEATSGQTGKRPVRDVRPTRAKTAGSRASDGTGDVRPPRWHSFLPGMFR